MKCYCSGCRSCNVKEKINKKQNVTLYFMGLQPSNNLVVIFRKFSWKLELCHLVQIRGKNRTYLREKLNLRSMLAQHASWRQQRGGWSYCLEQEEQQALWSGFKDVSQGLSVSWPSSHDRKSAFRHGGPTPTENMHTHHHHHQQQQFNTLTRSVCPCRVLKDGSHDLLSRQNSSQQFSAECHLCQKNWTGIRPLRTWWALSCSHLHEDNSAQMCGVWDLQHNSPPGLELRFHNTFGIH